jgi:hypothetical protein
MNDWPMYKPGRLSKKILRWASILGRPFHTTEAARKFGPYAWVLVRRLAWDDYVFRTGMHIHDIGIRPLEAA